MITKYYKCELLTDVVLNASLATEGNMQSLDYIPGSNFLGIVAEKYSEFDTDAYDFFHSGKVSFGDAHITKGNYVSYHLPFSLFLDKLNNDITTDKVWVHHGIDKNNYPEENGVKLQIKQQRGGYFNKNNDFFKKVEKEFSLKSAYDANERRSKESTMFGFEAIKKGQEFIFSVIYDDDKYVGAVEKILLGNHYIGKSKTAQFGLVNITLSDNITEEVNHPVKNNQLIIYAESNLCFFNQFGQATFSPNINKEFGINGNIVWDKSQIRTYSFSPWNNKRNTSSTQRDVILKGSVIAIELKDNVDVQSLPKQVGEYNAEGLGRVIYNPDFLEYDNNGRWTLEGRLNKIEQNESPKTRTMNKIDSAKVNTNLTKLLAKRNNQIINEKEISSKVIEVMNSASANKLKSGVTKTQWGAIREKATHAKDINYLIEQLFKPESGYLMHGVAAERIWDKQRGSKRKVLKEIIIEHKNLGTVFVAKFAAEMAKKVN